MACIRTFLWILGSCAFAPAALAQEREATHPQTAEIDLWPLRSTDPTQSAAEFVPVQAGDKVIVSSTVRLFAYDASSGALAWKTEMPTGWERLEEKARARLREGLYPAELLVAPAAANGVVVTSLQLPYARGPAEDWQGVPMRVELPERRLFAFDVASGLPMWNHAPPAKWDGKSGTLPERMNVVGSPLILGERVLVPCTSDPSSIDFLVAAYDLASGQLLWNTFVGRGQIERNAFDAQVREFPAAPLVASPDGERVLVQTKDVAIDRWIGAREGVLYFSGSATGSAANWDLRTSSMAKKIVAVTRAGGLRAEGPWHLLWTAPGSSTIRPQLVGAHLFTQGSDLLELDALTGASLASHALEPLRGLLVTDDAFFAVEEHGFLRLAR